MKENLNIWSGNDLIATVPIRWSSTEGNVNIYNIHYEDIRNMPEQIEVARRRRRRNRCIIDTIADPERGFPILRSLIQKFAPILIEYLMKQLPVWLADVEDLNEDEATA